MFDDAGGREVSGCRTIARCGLEPTRNLYEEAGACVRVLPQCATRIEPQYDAVELVISRVRMRLMTIQMPAQALANELLLHLD